MKKNVFLTGASGTMGWAGFQEFMKRKDQFNVCVLLRDSQKNREMFKDYMNDPSVRIVWGDFLEYDKILECVTGSEYVLHVGGLVSPGGDYYPRKTIQINPTAMANIVKAVKEQPNPDDIKVVYIGTVAETGDRNRPTHWGRTGDPIQISIYDHYAASKVMAEKIVAESGLKHWVSLRQSGILYPEILKNMDPIMFHVPINGVLEWATVEDSARMLVNVCGDDVPEEFWRGFYNIGSGKQYRITNFEFEELLLGTLGIGSTKKLFDANAFILQNFHGQWYYDSDKLEDYLHFRANIPVKEYFKQMMKKVEFVYKLAFLAKPFSFAVKPFLMSLAKKEIYGTLKWIETNDQDRISAYFGTKEKWEKVSKKWDDFDIWYPQESAKETSAAILLDHGYDESKPTSELDLEDMKKAAEFRGGECLSTEMVKGDMFTPLKWRCAHGHEFEMTPNLVLKGGHWCEKEVPTDLHWAYDKEAKVNPFFAQVWYSHHSPDEDNEYFCDIFKGFSGFETDEKIAEFKAECAEKQNA